MPSARLVLSVFVMAFGSLVIVAAPAHADATLDVTTAADALTDDGFCSFREAVLNANINITNYDDCAPNGAYGDDTINLVNGSTYSLSGGTLAITDDLTINGNSNPAPFQNVAVKQTVVGQQVFSVTSGDTVIFNDFVIQDAQCNSGSCDGAGVQVSGTAHFDEMSLGNNQAGFSRGGAIYNAGVVSLSNSIVAGNTATGDGSAGGGIYNSGNLTISDSRLTNNSTTESGGGIYNNGGVVFIARSTISGHGANESGGGIYNNGGAVQISNSTISGNVSLEDGGGIYTSGAGSSLSTFYTTISNNTADFQDTLPGGQGGGIAHPGDGTVNLLGTIIAGNSDASNDPPNDAPDCSGSMTSDEYNMIGIEDNCLDDVSLTDITGIPGDPLNFQLHPLGNYGGPTMTHMPTIFSPAFNAGEEEPCTGPDASTIASDQRGMQRPQDEKCDIGAVERESVPPTVPTLTAPNKRWQPDKDIDVEWTAAEDTLAVQGGSINYTLRARAATYKNRRLKDASVSGGGPLTSSTESVSPGKTICYKVRAVDIDFNTSVPSNETCTAVPVNDRSLTPHGKWKEKDGDDYYLEDYVQTRKEGNELVLKKIRKAKRMALVATKCPTCGSVKVYMAGDLLKKVSLQADAVQNRKFISLGKFASPKTGLAKIEVTSDGKPVKIEGLGISKI